MNGRTAVVTGGAGDIGTAIGSELHRHGASVVLADLEAGDAEAAAAELNEADGPDRALGVACDVRDRDSIRSALDAAEAAFGPVEILVNNAGLQIRRPFFEIEGEEWDEILAVNLRGVMYGCQLAGERMRERGYGRIVNHSSIAGQQGGLVMGAHYAASKAGMLALTKIVASELAGAGVTVNSIAPAAIEGKLTDSLGAEQISALRDRIPVGRLGRPADVAHAVAFLSAEEAGYITGATLDLNGGVFMR